MTDAAMTSASTHIKVLIREPAGERTFGETPTIGGPGADIVIPGCSAGPALSIGRHQGTWNVTPQAESVRFDGRALLGTRELHRHDVFSVGDAQVCVNAVSRTLLRLEVFHLSGNDTVSPASTVATLAHTEGDDDLRIGFPALAEPLATANFQSWRPPRGLWMSAGIAAAVVLLALSVLAAMKSLPITVDPEDANVRTPGTLLALHLPGRLLMFSGSHVIRAERPGFTPAERAVQLPRDAQAGVQLRLTRLPGILQIDTGGIASVVSVDGVEAGPAPSSITVAAGQHTISIRAPRYVDFMATTDIDGGGVRQVLKAQLQPSWGTLQISSIPAGARVSVDGENTGVSPVITQSPSGVRRVRIALPGFKVWESSMVLKAGEVLSVGPIALGQPDTPLTLRSQPAGAEVTIGGVLRGTTPLAIELPAGIQHEVLLQAPGYAAWSRQLFAEPGKRIVIDATLVLTGARMTVKGEPAGAQLWIDGSNRGSTPQSLILSATEHRIEVRKEGWGTFSTVVTPASGLDRALDYRLVSQLQALAASLYSQTGYVLRRVAPGSFQAQRADNEASLRISLQRPFYLGTTEVTNEQFRRFRPAHSSETAGRRGMNQDSQPVVNVSWQEAAEFCNWLSERDSLPPAYELYRDRWVLRRPVTIGYRLPTDAEWEYAARSTPPTKLANVSEWVNDYFATQGDRTVTIDPLGPAGGARHVIRAANWRNTASIELRPDWRDGADGPAPVIGFRISRYAE